MINIVCLGEALIDFKQTGQLAFQGYAGGSPMNVAIAAARLGGEVAFGGQVSSDMFGLSLRDYLRANNVNMHYLMETDAPTSLAFVAEIDGNAHFSFISNGAADTEYNPRPRPQLPDSVKFIQFGSKSLLDEPTSSSIIDIVAMHQDKACIVLDPNVRPALIADRNEYLQAIKRWIGLADIVKVSTQDLDWLEPEMSCDDLAKAWLELGPSIVIVTDGEKGATLYRKAQSPLHVPAPKVKVVDTVGAGDTFTGSLMVALLKRDLNQNLAVIPDDVWLEVLKLAVAAAAFNCTRAGANPPNEQELTDFIQTIV